MPPIASTTPVKSAAMHTAPTTTMIASPMTASRPAAHRSSEYGRSSTDAAE